MQLSGIDLNLLPLLHALLETASVQAAARRVGLSASAASHALNRLREVLEDPLLVRAGRSMVLSNRGQELRPLVARAVEQLGAVFEAQPPGDPATARRSFTVACTDYTELVVLQPLSEHLSQHAPGIDLFGKHATSAVLEQLRSGTMDLATVVLGNVSDDLHQQRLFDDHFVCLFRKGHPALRGRWTMKRYAELQHVLVAPRGESPRGVVDQVLAEAGHSRHVARTVSSFLVAPHLLAGTDYVLTVSARVAALVAEHLDLETRRPPVDIPGFSVALLWHDRQHDDPIHTWVREQIAALVGRG